MALAVAVFAGQADAARASLVAMPAALAVAGAAFAGLGAPDVSAMAFCVVAAGATALARPQWVLLPPLAAGLFAAAWSSVLRAQGLPWLPAVLLAVAVLLGARAVAARRAGFAPPELRDEALVVVASFGLLLAVGPDVVAGWRSAVSLKAEPLAGQGGVGPWLGALALGCVLLGGAYTAWKRR
jgi:hypothetical protein